MKQIKHILFATTIILLMACGQTKIETPTNAMAKFTQFIEKEKFGEDVSAFYPGIADTTMRPILTEKINLAANDFKILAASGNATEQDYQDKIETGLKRFSDVYISLDTEDRERVCKYFEELMDIVGLESSGGHLNDFMYGFDPTK